MIAHPMGDPHLNLLRIGGSDAAAVLGVSDYSARFDVWLRIVKGVRSEQTASMRAGRKMERAIGAWWAEERGIEIEWLSSIEHPTREWQRLTPDVVVRSWPGEIADMKRSRSARDRHGMPGTDEIADYELVQLQTYLEGLHSLGHEAEVAHLVVHDLYSDELLTWTTRRDESFGALIVEECERFWRDHVLTERPPEMSGSATVRRWLEQRAPKDTEPKRFASIEEAALAHELHEIQLSSKSLETRAEIIKNMLRESIGKAKGITGDFGSISYAAVEASEGIDWVHVAQHLAMDLHGDEETARRAISELARQHTKITRQPHRRLAPYWRTNS